MAASPPLFRPLHGVGRSRPDAHALRQRRPGPRRWGPRPSRALLPRTAGDTARLSPRPDGVGAGAARKPQGSLAIGPTWSDNINQSSESVVTYGLPHKPFIQQILPHGLSLPRVPKGDQVWQHSEACQQRVDADGNWLRQTDGKIQDKAIEREVEAMANTEHFQSHTRAVDDHSTETVGGIKKIEALGALKLLSGGTASLAAVDDLHQATGRDLNLVVGQKHNATVGGDMLEQIQGVRQSLTMGSQRLEAPQTWLGSEGVNVLKVLCDLLDIVEQMNTQLAGHTHGPSPVPSNASAFTGAGGSTKMLAAQLKPITL